MTMRKQANKKNLMPLLKRVLGIMLREYKVQFGLVVVLILGAALATLRGTLFMRDLVDVYIKPMIGMESPDFGPLAHALLSPGRHVDKEYECHLAHTFDAHQRELLEQGVDIGEKKKCRPAVVRILAEKKITLTITEGRFHQVKRMLHAVGNEVVYLKRIRMDRLQLEDSLEKGAYRRLTDEEVEGLRGR